MTRTSPAADGYAEREAANITVNDARQAANNAQPQITLDAGKGCAISVQRRKLIEQGFGDRGAHASSDGACAQKVDQMFVLTMAPYNPLRYTQLRQNSSK